MIERMISSPSPMDWPSEDATRLSDSVADRVKMISSVEAALRNARVFSRAPSKASVAALAR